MGVTNWSVTVIEERRLKVFKNRVPRRIFGSRKEEMAGGWRRLHTEELHNGRASTNNSRVIKSRRMRWARHVARVCEVRNGYRILVGKPEWNKPLGKARRRWKSNLKWTIRDWMGGCVWFDLAQDKDQWRALVNTVISLGVP
jgi:hypothetical protein